ncbi:TPA: hypothetical protein F7162_12990 [Legionella pneumophila]|nr:hypothetical protein [Legionella pneumophila]
MILSQSRSSFISTLMLSSGVFLSMITMAHAGTNKDNQSSSEQLENTVVLNQGHDQHVTAHSLKELNGNQTFQSKLKIPGVSITEQVHQQTNGRTIQENKIIVNIAKNESVEFVQQFDGEGRKVSRSVIKRPTSVAESHISSAHKSLVASEGGHNDLAIEHQTTINGDGKYTTTTVRSNNFSLISGVKNWMLIASAGYDHFANAVNSDGSTGVARLALNRSLFRSSGFDFGLEAGIQNGVNMRPIVQEDILDALGGTPVLATIKPVIELLPTLSRRLSDNGRFIGFAKLGIAYRSMTFDRDTIPNISKISPDLHLGLVSTVSDTISLMVYYHVIFGGNPDINATLFPLPANNLGKAANIPTQQGVLLGIAYSF